ncbi:MAG: TIGR02584 family CRISPR-associated protein [Ignavibacteriaceae bacterium]|nr:TIGR02584 family CRISPR-associated protein [Ignavibacteriaceae bacterium]
MKNKNILVCVSGLTPQIVTETLFCLAVQKKVKVDEIYVLTTQRGRNVVLGKDEHHATPKSPLKKEINELCKKHKIKKPLFEENDVHIIVAKEESLELSDIRSDKDNILFPNKVCEFIRQKTSDPNNVLYCSITGGRKSMSVHIANALSLFAREKDKLLHVLTKEEHEFKGFYPVNKQQAKDLELAELPFVRIRSLLTAELKMPDLLKSNFDEIVKTTQAQLKILTPQNKMILDIERRELRFANNYISLEPMLFLFYYFFVDSKERGKENISVYEFISFDTKNRFLEYFATYYPTRHIKNQKWFEKGFSKEDFRVKRSKINSVISELIDDPDISSFFIIDVNRKYGESTYHIKAVTERFKIKF